MVQDVTIFVCDDEDKADNARGFLDGLGYANVTKERTGHLLYDAQTYDGGAKEHQLGKWVVVGRK
jgi:hypothetical protein